MKKVIAYILLAIVIVGSGCIGTVSEHLTPGVINNKVVKYNEAAGTGTAADYRGILFPSLAELRKLNKDFEAAVAFTNQELRQLAEKNKLEQDVLRGTLVSDIKLAEDREEFLWNPTTGAVALGLSLLGVGAGGYLGLMRKRPQDYTEIDLQKAVTEVKGELSDKERKIISLVKSMQNVIDAETEPEKQAAIIKILKDSQTPEARAAVKEAKAVI